MKPSSFVYHRPGSLEQCLDLLSQYGDEAALIAGGQNLVPLMRFKLAQPSHVISMAGFGPELPGIEPVAKGLAIGAMVTYRMVERSRDVVEVAPRLQQAIELIATPPVRTRGTLCGNLCQADPASELPAVALVSGAEFHLRSKQGERIVGAPDFFLGPYTTARRPDEIVTHVTFRACVPAERFVIQEVNRQRGGFPMAGVAISLQIDGERVTAAAVACFGVHATALRIPEAEVALCSLGLTEHGLEEAAAALSRTVEPHGDVFASAAYRRSAAQTLLKRALRQARTIDATG